MDTKEILAKIDYTLLKPCATREQVERLCAEALAFGTASVCIAPCFVAAMRAAFPTLTICTVIGFPLGFAGTAAKQSEAQDALQNGADELDMVVNLGDVKRGDFAAVTAEIAAVKHLCGARILKVIIETCYLDEQEKIALCRCVNEGGADFIKTSTGFGNGGATIEDVRLLRAHCDPRVAIKAAGGVRSRADFERFAPLCARIGASSIQTLTEETL